MKIMELVRTCSACPSQWEGIIKDEGLVYIRYRWGRLSIKFTAHGIDAVLGEEIFSKDIGHDLDGLLTNEELQSILKDEYQIIFTGEDNECN
jgi:hypothetical protein